MRAGSERLRRSAAVVLAVAACLTGGFFAAGAFGNRSADPPLIVLDRSIGAVSLGSTRAQVEAAYGKPFKQLVVVGAGGAPAVLAYYRVHGATLYVTYQSGRVVSIETSSNYYRTRGGLGPGSSIEDVPRGFFQDPCGLGVWTGAGPAFTVFTRDGNEVSSVLITLSSYFSACEGEGSAPPAPPEPPASPGGGTTGTFELTVNVEPSGYGYVTGSAGGISCPVNCNAPYGAGASIALTAHPSTGAQFDHWSGACSGSGGCVVLMDGPKHVTAHFTGAPFIPPTTPTTTTRPTTTGGGGGGGGGQSP